MLNKILMTLIFLLFSMGTSFGRVYLDVNQARSLFPIAIPAFKNLERQADNPALSKNMVKIISQDLECTGLFKILEPESYLENPQTAGVKAREIDFQNWAAIGAQGLVKGTFARKGKQITIEVRLFDVQSARLLSGRRYIGTDEAMRPMAHKISNLIYATLTGEAGIFETKIAYVNQSKGEKDLYVMDFDGYHPKRFTYHRSIVLSPRWSPDGSRVAFTSYKRGNPDLYVKQYFSREEILLSRFLNLNVAAAWSPDGKEIALMLSKDGNPEIYLMNNQGRNLRRLTNYWGIDVSPAWSPDGKKIAFVSNRSGSPQIYIMGRGGELVRRLTFQGSYNTEPDWSPRGDKIVYSSQRQGKFQICIINPDGTGEMQLTQAGSNESPKWSPHGHHIVFQSSRSVRRQIFVMRANGTQVKQLTQVGENYNPSWSPIMP